MDKNLRLDKYLADMGIGTRTQVKEFIRKGRVSVNQAICKEAKRKVTPLSDCITVDERLIAYAHMEYYMLNKPRGVVSATEDRYAVTVLDLLETKKRKDLFPVGRLDKDTEGLLLITNDGILAHSLLSPKRHVDKCYYALVEGDLPKDSVERFAQGIRLDEEIETLPAQLTIIERGETNKIQLILHEGKFHQVKRMFEALGTEVVYLKRISMGALILDESLELGEYRSLTDEEIQLIKEV